MPFCSSSRRLFRRQLHFGQHSIPRNFCNTVPNTNWASCGPNKQNHYNCHKVLVFCLKTAFKLSLTFLNHSFITVIMWNVILLSAGLEPATLSGMTVYYPTFFKKSPLISTVLHLAYLTFQLASSVNTLASGKRRMEPHKYFYDFSGSLIRVNGPSVCTQNSTPGWSPMDNQGRCWFFSLFYPASPFACPWFTRWCSELQRSPRYNKWSGEGHCWLWKTCVLSKLRQLWPFLLITLTLSQVTVHVNTQVLGELHEESESTISMSEPWMFIGVCILAFQRKRPTSFLVLVMLSFQGVTQEPQADSRAVFIYLFQL